MGQRAPVLRPHRESRGLPPDEAKARSPSCGKCAAAIMRELGLSSPLLPSSRRASKAVGGLVALMQ